MGEFGDDGAQGGDLGGEPGLGGFEFPDPVAGFAELPAEGLRSLVRLRRYPARALKPATISA